jgi:hypothetical protein
VEEEIEDKVEEEIQVKIGCSPDCFLKFEGRLA